MSIMNQAISPKGQPGFPHKASGPQEASSHHVPMALPLTHPLKQFQPGLSTRNNLSTIATGSPVDVAPSRNDLDPWALTFSRSIIEDENLNLLTDDIQRLDQNGVLTVAVSSAVKLDGKQIELISKKMRRLTGFRNLRLENIIDNSVIAGFVISYEDAYGSPQVIDLSVNGQLAALAARVESSDRRIIGHGQ